MPRDVVIWTKSQFTPETLKTTSRPSRSTAGREQSPKERSPALNQKVNNTRNHNLAHSVLMIGTFYIVAFLADNYT